MSSKPAELLLMSGAGNTFWIGHRKDFSVEDAQLPELAKRLCAGDQVHGSADGLLLLSPGPDAWKWDFYNADGSTAEMCGNAARCAAHLLDQENTSWPVSFLTGAGLVTARKRAGDVYEIEMPPAVTRQKGLALELAIGQIVGDWVDTGVPHVVITVRTMDQYGESVCSEIRKHPALGMPGANVTLVLPHADRIEAKTFERGVEGFTKACGTGAVAAAFAVQDGREGTYRVTMPGGELEVRIGQGRPQLIGRADILERRALHEKDMG